MGSISVDNVFLDNAPTLQSPTAALRASLANYSYQGASPALRRSLRKQGIKSEGMDEQPVTPSKRRAVTVKEEEEDDEEIPKKKRKSPVKRAAAVKEEQDEDEDDESPKKKRKSPVKVKRGYASPEKYAHLSPLTDHLAPELDVLFCGINPGCMSAERGHHFANPTNHFWRALHQGGFTPRLVSPSDDHTLPASYNLGLTNLVDRPSAEANELSNAEMLLSVPSFLQKIARHRPRIVCFVGKGIWVVVQRYLDAQVAAKSLVEDPVVAAEIKAALDDEMKVESEEAGPSNPSTPSAKSAKSRTGTPRAKKSPVKKKDAFEYGLQPYSLVLPPLPKEEHALPSPLKPLPADEVVEDTEFIAGARLRLIKQEDALPLFSTGQLASPTGSVTHTLLCATPSTSGRVVSHQLKDKIKLFGELKAISDSVKDGTMDTSRFKIVHI